jgi:hypothetical protein
MTLGAESPARRKTTMATKIQIESDCKAEIEKAEAELLLLEEEHKKFEQEDKDENNKEIAYKKNLRQSERLEEKAYIGNWITKSNRYSCIIPYEIERLFDSKTTDYNSKSRESLKFALKELSDEGLKEIHSSKEYKELLKERDRISTFRISNRHYEIHEKIDDLERTIRWNKNRIDKIQSRSGLIEVCKHLKENELRHKEEKEHL